MGIMTMQKAIGIVVLICALSLSACGGPATGPTAWQQAVITLERTACLGACPAYVVTIQGDGTVLYKGERNAAFIGARQGKVTPAAVQGLVAAFDTAGFWGLKDSYTGGPSDNPSALTTLVAGSRHKTINDYGGSPDAPKVLRNLEDQIDTIVSTTQWDR